MRQATGGVLLVIAAGFAYHFALFSAANLPPVDSLRLDYPFQQLGSGWPTDTFLLVGCALSLLLGFWLILIPPSTHQSPAARLFLLNGLLLLSTLFIAAVGSRAKAEPTLVGLFSALALAQIVAGLLLFIFSFKEHPKNLRALGVGMLLWVCGSAVGILAFVQGT